MMDLNRSPVFLRNLLLSLAILGSSSSSALLADIFFASRASSIALTNGSRFVASENTKIHGWDKRSIVADFHSSNSEDWEPLSGSGGKIPNDSLPVAQRKVLCGTNGMGGCDATCTDAFQLTAQGCVFSCDQNLFLGSERPITFSQNCNCEDTAATCSCNDGSGTAFHIEGNGVRIFFAAGSYRPFICESCEDYTISSLIFANLSFVNFNFSFVKDDYISEKTFSGDCRINIHRDMIDPAVGELFLFEGVNGNFSLAENSSLEIKLHGYKLLAGSLSNLSFGSGSKLILSGGLILLTGEEPQNAGDPYSVADGLVELRDCKLVLACRDDSGCSSRVFAFNDNLEISGDVMIKASKGWNENPVLRINANTDERSLVVHDRSTLTVDSVDVAFANNTTLKIGGRASFVLADSRFLIEPATLSLSPISQDQAEGNFEVRGISEFRGVSGDDVEVKVSSSYQLLIAGGAKLVLSNDTQGKSCLLNIE